MKETIVYLPEPARVEGSMVPVFLAQDVYSALVDAGIECVTEEPKEYQIRMLKLQIEELKCVCIKLQGELKEAQEENRSLAAQVDELDDQNEALKMTTGRAQEELRKMKDHNAMLKSALRQYQEPQP